MSDPTTDSPTPDAAPAEASPGSPDPMRRAAELVTATSATPAEDTDRLERRLKRDALSSIGRIKPDLVQGVELQRDLIDGDFFATLPAPLQGIAIARSEGMRAFYRRVGWRAAFLDEPLERCVPDEALQPLRQRYHAHTLHDLAYVHPKHFEKLLDKPGAASLWESLKRFGAA